MSSNNFPTEESAGNRSDLLRRQVLEPDEEVGGPPCLFMLLFLVVGTPYFALMADLEALAATADLPFLLLFFCGLPDEVMGRTLNGSFTILLDLPLPLADDEEPRRLLLLPLLLLELNDEVDDLLGVDDFGILLFYLQPAPLSRMLK
jgi:hypothetical protein